MTTCAENLRMLTRQNKGQWIPFTFDIGSIPGFTGPITQQFRDDTDADDPAEYFNYDFRTYTLPRRFGGDNPAKFHDKVEPGTFFDEWAIGHWTSPMPGVLGKTYMPLAKAKTIKDIEKLPDPIIDEKADLSKVKDCKKRGYPIFGYGGSIYELCWFLRGMEQFMMDMLVEPIIAEALTRKAREYTKKLSLAQIRAGIDVLCFYDDAGMQTSLQMSPQAWRKFIKPCWKDILDTIHRESPETICFLHSCGKITQVVPDIVDVGFDILHPIQPECMDIAEIKKQFGKDITLCATLSSQQLLPFGSPDDVKKEVRRLKKLFADTGRCILCPSNAIQPETPWANVLAFAEEAQPEET